MAGMPNLSSNSPSTFNPGVMMVDLIGSNILKFLDSFPKPCHFSFCLRIQASLFSKPSSDRFFGPQTLNHQSCPHSSSTFLMARLKSSDSRIDSSTNAVPPGASIIAAATSQLAIIEYCGLVEVCIR